MKTAFEPHGFLLTAAVGMVKEMVDIAYDIGNMSRHLDYINLMTYDFYGPWIPWTGHNSPLYPNPHEDEAHREMSIQFTVDYYLQNGAERHKLLLGIPLYAYIFQLAK